MTHLYSCRHDGDQYRITKFDSDLEVVSSYLCTPTECECPAGQRPMCRHREMLPWFVNRPAIGTGEYFDFDRGGWVMVFPDNWRNIARAANIEITELPRMSQQIETTFVYTTNEPPLAITGAEFYAPIGKPDLPEGVTAIGLDDPELVHNAIADAVGEPRLKRQRRFRWR